MSKKRLKIGVVVDQLLAGGVQLVAIEQVKELRKLGHEAKLLILMRKKYPVDFSYLVKGIPHRYLSDSYPLFFRQTIKFPIFSFFSTLHLMSPILAPRVIQEDDFDILISHGTTTCLTTQALWRKRKIPYFAVIHDPMVYILEKIYAKTLLRYLFPVLRRLTQKIERSFVKEAQETIIVSSVHFPYLKDTYGVEAKILTHGTKLLDKLPPKRGDYLLSFGRWQKEKNPHFLVRLVEEIPGAKLIIAGTWTSEKDLQQLTADINKRKLQKKIKIISHFSEKELAGMCANSRLWLHAHFETFGLAALEAAAQGLPIIIPEKSGVTEIFQNGIHGFFPKKIEVKEYKKYVQRLLNDERLAYKMGRAAWLKVKKDYSWLANTQKLLKIINSVLGIGKKPNLTVLEISHSKGTSLGGGDKLMESMAKRLTDSCDFTIITSRIGSGHWLKSSIQKEMKILPKNKWDANGEPVPVFLTYCLRMWRAYKVLQAEKVVNLLYSSTNILPDILPAYFFKKRHPEVKWIARIHHLIPPPQKREGRITVNIVSYLMQALSLWMIKRKADIIIALNQNLWEKLTEMGFPKDRLTTLGAGIELKEITSVKPANQPSFDGIFLGRLHPAKGVFDAIPIWVEVNKHLPEAKLAIIGDGSSSIKHQLKESIQTAGLTDKISLLGFLSNKEVYGLMKKAKIFVFLDHEAGWGLAAAEAMTCGLPVVGYNTGVLGTVFKKGFQTVPSFDKHLFAQKVIQLLESATFRQKLSQAAISQAKKLDWDFTAQRFFQILNQTTK